MRATPLLFSFLTVSVVACGGRVASEVSDDAGAPAPHFSPPAPIDAGGTTQVGASVPPPADAGADSGVVAEPIPPPPPPAPAPPVPSGEVLLPNMTPNSIALDGVDVYWANEGTFPDYHDGAIMRMPLAGGAPTVLASALHQPGRIAVRGGIVYWTMPLEGTVMSILAAGGQPSVVAANQQWAYGIAVDDQNLYWGTFEASGVVRSIPLGGGDVVTLASGQDRPRALALDVANAYWTTAGGAVMAVPLAGGSPRRVAGADADAGGLATDGENLYWLTPTGVWKSPCAGVPDGVTATLLSPPQEWNSIDDTIGVDGEAQIAVFGKNVYWTEGDGTTGVVATAPTTPGPVTRLSSFDHQPAGIAVGPSGLYWGDLGRTDTANLGSLRRTALP